MSMKVSFNFFNLFRKLSMSKYMHLLKTMMSEISGI
jgi:hypothetical protein